MLQLSSSDDALRTLTGQTIPSAAAPGISYAVGVQLGSGAASVAFGALRLSPEGTRPVALKFLRPSFLARHGDGAAQIMRREAIALGRLNERVPPTPFVVRLIDTGMFDATLEGREVKLPFLVTEYIHGGAEGATLYDRVTRSIRATGSAFDPLRAVLAIEGIAAGLAAVHEVGVIHRNVTPNNVLCCGPIDDEMCKIADFGVARPSGLPGTVTGMFTGTPGYAAPEVIVHEPDAIGPWSDVFSFAAVVFFLLTGEPYFEVNGPGEAVSRAVEQERKSILGTLAIHPTLAARERACKAIDSVLAWASAGRPESRLQEVLALSAMLVPHLRSVVEEEAPGSVPQRRALARRATSDDEAWVWTSQSPSGSMDVIRSVGWEPDGRCLAATSTGLAFWNGTAWQAARVDGLPMPAGLRFVSRVEAGRWLVGGDGATLALYTTGGVTSRWNIADTTLSFERLAGDLADVAVLVSVANEGHVRLHPLVGRRWLKPYELTDARSLTSIARVDDSRWLLVGRGVDDQAFAAMYAPFDWALDRMRTPGVRAFVSSAGVHARGLGLAVGSAGAALWIEGGAVTHECIDPNIDVSACAIDSEGWGWAASAGYIWRRDGRGNPRWSALFHDPRATAPIISLFVAPDFAVAVTADGGILEGRKGL